MNRELELIAEARTACEKATGVKIPLHECCTLIQAEELMEVLLEWVELKRRFCGR